MVKTIWKSYRLLNFCIVGLTIFAFCKINANAVKDATHIPGFWDHFVLFLLAGSILLYGNLKNDFFDQEVDTDNRKSFNAYFHFSRKTNRAIGFISLTLGLIAAFYLGIYSSYFFFFYWFVAHGLLWFYNLYAKKIMILGNITVALVTSFTVYLPFIFYQNYFPYYCDDTCEYIVLSPKAALLSTLFFVLSFFVNWNREVIKDIQDQYGDRVHYYKTMPLVWGEEKTIPFLLYGHLVVMIGLGYMFFYSLINTNFMVQLLLGITIIGLFYISWLYVKQHYIRISLAYKIILAVGVLTVFFIA